ncbi:hypothetical protein J6O48_00935 [bacterium]|nr:hypothetical protein [bacterium]
MVTFNPKVTENMFRIGGVNPFGTNSSFTGGTLASGSEYSERYGAGKAAGVESNGVIGSVIGTGENGSSRADDIAAKWGLGSHLYG